MFLVSSFYISNEQAWKYWIQAIYYTICLNLNKVKVKVSPVYQSYVREYLLERTLVLGHRLFEVGWPVPFFAAFIFPVFPPGPHLLLGGQWASVQP